MLTPEMRKKLRQEECMQRSKNWKSWREEEANTSDNEETEENGEDTAPEEGSKTGEAEKTDAGRDEEEETELLLALRRAEQGGGEVQEEEELEPSDMDLGEMKELCLKCVNIPCLCTLLCLEMRMEMLRGLKRDQRKEKLVEAVGDREQGGEVVQEVVLLPHETHGQAAVNQVESNDNNNQIHRRKKPEPGRTKEHGPIHHEVVEAVSEQAGEVVRQAAQSSVSKLSLKGQLSTKHGHIHRENVSEVVLEAVQPAVNNLGPVGLVNEEKPQTELAEPLLYPNPQQKQNLCQPL